MRSLIECEQRVKFANIGNGRCNCAVEMSNRPELVTKPSRFRVAKLPFDVSKSMEQFTSPALVTTLVKCGSIVWPSSIKWVFFRSRENSKPPSSSSILRIARQRRLRSGAQLSWSLVPADGLAAADLFLSYFEVGGFGVGPIVKASPRSFASRFGGTLVSLLPR